MIKVGDRALITRTFTQRDYDRFAALSGDDNPIHVDPEFARTTRFGRTLCHGMLLYSTLCATMTTVLPPGFGLSDGRFHDDATFSKAFFW